MFKHPITLSWFLCLGIVSSIQAGLYTEPVQSAKGGIEGRIENPNSPIQEVFAIPPSHPEKVYRATITASDRKSFRFTGLPMDRYDLVVLYEDSMVEGLRLARRTSTLTAKERKQIEESIQSAEAFFNVKIIHRLEGQTGRGNEARAFCTFSRDKKEGTRNVKLVILKQVGIGWQIVRTRELHRIELKENEPSLLRHIHQPELSGIRVTDHIKQLGTLKL